MSTSSVLIIGHGYVGAALAESLWTSGASVASVNRAADASCPYPVISGDVSTLGSLKSIPGSLPFSGPDVIVHCASSSRGGADAYRAVFIDGLKNLREIFPAVPIIFTSSSSVYGQIDGSVVDENSPASPDRETSRLLCEAEVLARGSGGIALRLAGIYGPGRSVHLRKILEGTATIDEGEVSRFLNQIHQDDVIRAITHLIEAGIARHGGALFNVVDDHALTQRECYESLASFFGVPVPPEAPPALDRKRAWTNKVVSNAALRATGWEPRYPSFLDAVKNDPRLVPSIREQIEQGEN